MVRENGTVTWIWLIIVIGAVMVTIGKGVGSRFDALEQRVHALELRLPK